jgi:hypothetical protein
MKHTKGNWITTVEYDKNCYEVGTHSERIAIIDYENGTKNEAEANAKLIAAAPELLEALEQCIPAVRQSGLDITLNRALEAIKKASEALIK